MNARLYDPVLGRMLSVDNIIDTKSTQGLNAYSYANNNPLIFVDPDGNLPILIPIVAAVIGGSLNLWSNWDKVNGDFWTGASYFANGAVGGAVGVFNPYAGGAITSLSNIGTDALNPNFQLPETPLGTIGYIAKTALDGLSAAGAGKLATGIVNQAGKWFWKRSLNVIGTQVGNNTTGILLPTAEIIETKVFEGAGQAAAAKVGQLALPNSGRLVKHHILPEKFRPIFEKYGIEINNYVKEIPEIMNGSKLPGQLHYAPKGTPFAGRGGYWNKQWSDFLSTSPKSASEIFKFAEDLMLKHGISGPYIIY
jgi:hypothetical protein